MSEVPQRNIVLIGMMGSGKTTVGRALAAGLDRPFLDTDDLILAHEQRKLSAIIAEEGRERFLEIEQKHVLALDVRGYVLSTGGSMIYSAGAMEHLKAQGTVVWLDCPLEDLAKRLGDLDARGVVRLPGQTLADLVRERVPLLERWADARVDAGGEDIGATVHRVRGAIGH
ncbi:MAG: shikimate kinase [Planctomycetota bacterium]